MQYAQAYQLTTLLIAAFIAILALVVAREIVCWYFKINEINKHLAAIHQALIEKRPTP